MNIQILDGSGFLSSLDSGLIVNEAFVKKYGLVNPVGRILPGPFPYPIRGVVKDFNIESLHTGIKPLMLALNFDAIARTADMMVIRNPLRPKICVKLNKGNVAEQLAVLKSAWEHLSPGLTFDFSLVDDKVAQQYIEDQKTSDLIKIASILSILIACAGLYGVVSIAVAGRTKEIAIRKVLGAAPEAIMAMISKQFLFLVLIACLIAIPLSWFAINRWLADFAFREDLDPILFVIACISVLAVALVTILTLSYRTATANPAAKLRSQ